MSRVLYGLFLVSWLGYVIIQLGEPYDEAEHCHVAWLIAKGQEPLHDFFQHHQRVLWDLLRIYFSLGGEGVGVLHFGRALVAACALVCAAGLWSLVVTLSKRNRADGPRLVPGTLGLALLGGSALAFPTLFVIRPETVSTALYVLSVVVWTRGARDQTLCWRFPLADVAAGALWGLAAYTSPRFLLLGGTYVLLPARDGKVFPFEWQRLGRLGVGAVLACAAYSAVVGVSWTDIAFNIVFSAKLQEVGDGSLEGTSEKALFGALALGLSLAVWSLVPSSDRIRYGLLLTYWVATVAASIVSAGRYPYLQNFFVPIVWLAVVWSWAEARIPWEQSRLAPGIALLGLAAALSAGAGTAVKRALFEGTLADSVAERRALLQLLTPGDVVLLRSGRHPIVASNVSYYGMPLVDSRDRLCEAVRAVERIRRLPPCDYLSDVMRKRPTLLDPIMFRLLPEGQAPQLERLVASEYRQLPSGVFVLRDR